MGGALGPGFFLVGLLEFCFGVVQAVVGVYQLSHQKWLLNLILSYERYGGASLMRRLGSYDLIVGSLDIVRDIVREIKNNIFSLVVCINILY